MKKRKRIFALFMAVLLIVALIPSTAFADRDYGEDDNVEIELDSNSAQHFEDGEKLTLTINGKNYDAKFEKDDNEIEFTAHFNRENRLKVGDEITFTKSNGKTGVIEITGIDEDDDDDYDDYEGKVNMEPTEENPPAPPVDPPATEKGTLKVVKTATGANVPDNAVFSVYSKNAGTTSAAAANYSQFTAPEATTSGSPYYEFTLAPGEYTVIETGADVDGYDLNTAVSYGEATATTITVNANETATVTVTNTYTPKQTGGGDEGGDIPPTETFTVKYIDGTSTVGTVTVNKFDIVDHSKVTTPTKDGFEFVEWELLSGKYAATAGVTENLIYQAKWKAVTGGEENLPVEDIFKIYYYKNISGTATEEIHHYDEFNTKFAVLIDRGTLTRNGYKFVGWNTAQDGRGVAYKEGSTIILKDSITHLYAQWEKDTTSGEGGNPGGGTTGDGTTGGGTVIVPTIPTTPVTPTTPEEPGEQDKPSKPEKPAKPITPTDKDASSDDEQVDTVVPKTGDETPTTILFSLLLLTLSAFVGTITLYKKNSKK